MKHIAATLVATQLAGCSFMFSRPPAPVRPGRPVEPCSASRLAPAFDTYQAIGSGVLALMFFSLGGDDTTMNDDDVGVRMGAISAVLAAAYGVSASYGYRQARACREQQQAYVVVDEPLIEVPADELEVEEETEIHTTIRSRTRVRPIVRE